MSSLVRKRTSTELMLPPPPPKKIKRPKTVLEEDEYTEALSQIIARDFFPALGETQMQHEYLNALDSKDRKWISSTGKKLQDAMTPGMQRSIHAPTIVDGGRSPSVWGGDTPTSIAATVTKDKPKINTSMSLAKFQGTYTSEDNESFYKLLDKQNQKTSEKHAWLWNGNKFPSKQTIKQQGVRNRLALTTSLVDDGFKRDRLAIRDVDERPAHPETWDADPRNGLMFLPESVEDRYESPALKAQSASAMGPERIIYENTRIPQPTRSIPARPPSPTMSAVRDAVAGHVREVYKESSVIGGDETPRVNGYAFVDDEDDDPEAADLPVIDLGPGDATPNPFKIQEQRQRESLHYRMVEKITQSKRESSKNGMTGRVEITPVPRFPSSPRVSVGLTPAAQRLWNKIGNSPRAASKPVAQSTMRPRRTSRLSQSMKQ